MLRFLSLLVVAAAIALGFQPADQSAEKDVYAIFSLMLNNPNAGHGRDDNERFLIAETTGPGNPRNPCVHPPKEREADFREVLADFGQRKDTTRKLERRFELRKPYILLNAEDAQKFAGTRLLRQNDPRDIDERFRGVVDLFTLTDVYFNSKRTLAVTAIEAWCGGLCASWQWKVFEKRDDNWRELDWNACIVVSENRVWQTDHHAKETVPPVRGGVHAGRAITGSD